MGKEEKKLEHSEESIESLHQAGKGKGKLTPFQLTFCIFGFVLLGSFIILPPVFRICFKEEKPPVVQPTPTPTSIPDPTPNPSLFEPEINDTMYDRLVCNKEDTSNDNYRETLGIVLSYEDDMLKIVTESSNRIYNIEDEELEGIVEEFDSEKQSCDNLSDDYRMIKGYNHACTSGEDSIYVVRKFDLGRFEPTLITGLGDSDIEITTKYSLDQSIEELRESLEDEGYSCS